MITVLVQLEPAETELKRFVSSYRQTAPKLAAWLETATPGFPERRLTRTLVTAMPVEIDEKRTASVQPYLTCNNTSA